MRDVTPSFHKQVMDSKHKFIVVRAARRTGKTTLMVEWAKSKKGSTMILVMNQFQVGLVMDMMTYELGSALIIKENGYIETNDGRKYHIVSAHRGTHVIMGMNIDHVVVDEFGGISKEWMKPINQIKACGDGDILMLSSSIKPGSISEMIEEYDPCVQRLNYTWRDASRDDMFNKQDLENLIGAFSKESFIDEFGPWDGFWGKVTNEDYTHLLHQ